MAVFDTGAQYAKAAGSSAAMIRRRCILKVGFVVSSDENWLLSVVKRTNSRAHKPLNAQN